MEKLRCQTGVEYKGKIIFSASTMNGLLSLDLDSGEIIFLKVFEKEDLTYGLYREVFLCGNEAWFIPAKAENFVCVNLDSYEMRYYPVPYDKRKKHNAMISFIACFMYEDKIYCVPRNVDTAVRINTISHSIERFDNVIDPFSDITCGGFVINNKFKLFLKNKREEIDIDMLTGEQTRNPCSMIDDSTLHVCSCGKYVLDKHKGGRITIYDSNYSEMRTVQLPYDQEDYFDALKCGGEIVLLPIRGRHIISINPDSGDIHELEMGDTPMDIFADASNKMGVIRSGNDTYITTEYTGYILRISGSRILKCYSLDWSNVFADSLKNAYSLCGRLRELYGEEIIKEDGYIKNLTGFLELLSSSNDHI